MDGKPHAKHGSRLSALLADSHYNEGLTHFPPAGLVDPDQLARLAKECLLDYAPNSRCYRDGAIIRDLVFTLMEEWGWTKEIRNG